MRALVLIVLLAACGDNVKVRDDGGTMAGSDAPPASALGPCLDRPTNAVAQPGGALPCELISPAFEVAP